MIAVAFGIAVLLAVEVLNYVLFYVEAQLLFLGKIMNSHEILLCYLEFF